MTEALLAHRLRNIPFSGISSNVLLVRDWIFHMARL